MNPLTLLTLGSSAQKVYVEDVYNAYAYKGTAAARTITDNVDRTKGALDVFKSRSAATVWAWYDTKRGVQKDLSSSATAAETTQTAGVTAVGSTGVTFGNLASINASGATFMKYTYRVAPKFFQIAKIDHVNGVADTIDLGALGTVGMVVMKASSVASSWFVWHRSLAAGQGLLLHNANAQAASTTLSVSGTTLTVAAATATGTYVIYAWAHDTDANNGIIQCGSFATDASGNATITLPWEPQEVLVKIAVGATGNWIMKDEMRFIPSLNSGGGSAVVTATNPGPALAVNAATAETTDTTVLKRAFQFQVVGLTASATYVYRVIRRGPMRSPSSGAVVYQPISRAGTGTNVDVNGNLGGPIDAFISNARTIAAGHTMCMRNWGPGRQIGPGAGYVETTNTTELTSFALWDSVSLGISDVDATTNAGGGTTYMQHFFRRWPKVFDIVDYSGTGANQTVKHMLGVAPELWIAKCRGGPFQWAMGSIQMAANEWVQTSETPAAKAVSATIWQNKYPTATDFYVGVDGKVNVSGEQQLVWLFASLPGVSKVFKYTGNGGTLNVNCGFATGARFVAIKRVDAAGDFWWFNTALGIVAAAEVGHRVNVTEVEKAAADGIDPLSSGFSVVQEAQYNLNVNGGTYIGIAIA